MGWFSRPIIRVLPLFAIAMAIFAAAPSSGAKAAPFYLKSGDRVVFYGDSITDQRLYTTYIESYCVSRFPTRHFTFVHSGWGGDRVTGGGGGPVDTRLKRDVLAYKPTVVTICLGMNDGAYRPFDKGIFDTYVNGYRHILDTLIKQLPGVRITLVTASAYDDVTRTAGFLGGYNSTLLAYGEAVRALGREYGLTVADTNAPLVAALAKAHSVDADLSTQILRDRVHPGPGGHLVMAAAVLAAWSAPSTVASIEIKDEPGKANVLQAVNTQVSDLTNVNGRISFTETDRALPWPLDRDPANNKDMLLTLSVTDVERDLNRYNLKIDQAESSRYSLTVDGTDCGTVTREELAAGVDLAALKMLPANVQAQGLLATIRKHNDLHFQRWRQVQVTQVSDGLSPSEDTLKKMNALDAEESAAEEQLSRQAVPVSHKVVLAPLP